MRGTQRTAAIVATTMSRSTMRETQRTATIVATTMSRSAMRGHRVQYEYNYFKEYNMRFLSFASFARSVWKAFRKAIFCAPASNCGTGSLTDWLWRGFPALFVEQPQQQLQQLTWLNFVPNLNWCQKNKHNWGIAGVNLKLFIIIRRWHHTATTTWRATATRSKRISGRISHFWEDDVMSTLIHRPRRPKKYGRKKYGPNFEIGGSQKFGVENWKLWRF
jgi:hypothetical protein